METIFEDVSSGTFLVALLIPAMLGTVAAIAVPSAITLFIAGFQAFARWFSNTFGLEIS